MPEAIKNIYSKPLLKYFVESINEIYPSFQGNSFLVQVFDEDWNQKSFKQRINHISDKLFDYLPPNYLDAAEILLGVTNRLSEKRKDDFQIDYLFIPDYIGKYGLEEYEISIKAIEQITQLSTCEFAIRPFLEKYPDKVLSQVISWSRHEHYLVRRLASEGTRPRLPWATQIDFLRKNPTKLIPILENLLDDKSEIVRRSVANNINDISKDHPELVLDFVRKWKGYSIVTDKLLRHGIRSLLKKNNQEALTLMGMSYETFLEIQDFKIFPKKIRLDESLKFSFNVINNSGFEKNLRVEYSLCQHKHKGKRIYRKYFISERRILPNSVWQVKRSHLLRNYQSRKINPGFYNLSIILNGIEFDPIPFELS